MPMYDENGDPIVTVVLDLDQEPEPGQEWDEEEAGCTYAEYLRRR